MRPRERYVCAGPDPAGDAELLALVLGTGVAGRSALDVAVGLLDRFEGLQGVARASVQELEAVRGVGRARAIRVHAGLHAGRRSLRAGERAGPVARPASAMELLGPALRGLVDEELHGLFLDRRRHLLAHRMLTRGSDAFTVVDPRQVYRVALRVGAAALILAHNHPSGDPTPSTQDREVTRRVAAAGRVLGIPLLDHLVVGDASWVSMAEEGSLPAWEGEGPCWTA